jgi:hypothetical protein
MVIEPLFDNVEVQTRGSLCRFDDRSVALLPPRAPHRELATFHAHATKPRATSAAQLGLLRDVGTSGPCGSWRGTR